MPPWDAYKPPQPEQPAAPQAEPQGPSPTFDAVPDQSAAPIEKPAAKPEPKEGPWLAYQRQDIVKSMPLAGEMPMTGPMMDEYVKNSAVGKIIHAFGEGFGPVDEKNPIGLTPGGDAEKYLQKVGILPDFNSSYFDLGKYFNEGIVRPAAFAADIATRTMSGGFRALQESLYQGVSALPIPTIAGRRGELLARDIAGGLEAAQGHPHGVVPGVEGAPASWAADRLTAPRTPEPFKVARENNVIGKGEAGWKGFAEETPQKPGEPLVPDAEPPSPGVAMEPPPPKPFDVHAEARAAAPETFKEYDALSTRRDTFRRWINELNEKRTAEAPEAKQIAELEAKMEDATPRLAKKYQARIDALQETLDAQRYEDTPEIARIRAELQKADERMRDLAPDVSQAYRDAQERAPEVPGAEPAAEPPKPVAEAPAAPQEPSAEGAPEPAQQAPEAAPAPAEAARPARPPVRQPAPDIARHVADKLEAAGRPKEEATAAGALIAAHYEARAARFGGERGTAQDLYAAEGADIRGPGAARAPTTQGAMEFAQIPPERARQLNIQTKLPTSEEFTKAVENTPGAKIDPDGVILNLTRYQHEDQAGAPAIRTGVFYLPEGSKNSRHYRNAGTASNRNQYGGTEEIKGNTLLRAPIFVKGATGGKAPEIAYDAIKGKGAYQKMRDEVLQATGVQGLSRGISEGDKIRRIARTLEEFGSDPSIADELWANSQKGNQLAYAMQENIVAHAVREAGYDSVLGYSEGRGENKGKPFISEVFDVREDRYPSAEGDYSIHQKYEQANRGKIAFRDGKATISLMKNADASTFIHETGHQWLEELLGDAKDERAPDDLLQDAQAVRDWLGMQGDRPTRAQHEKFARGFERYLMEGRAPSAKLAGVFQQFKNWLTQIYQTVKALKSPITDDIRKVFDRMLATPEEKPLITPDRAGEENFATRHETEAEHTPAAQAISVADRMRAERDEQAKAIPELDDERRAERSGGRDTQGSEIPDRGGDEGQPGAGPTGAGEKSGAERAGGTEPAAEGEGEPGGGSGEPGAPRAAEKSPEPTGQAPNPNDTPADAPTEKDLAGNIRLENLNGTEAINSQMRQWAADNADWVAARRGVVTDQEVSDLADAMGVEARKINIQKLREMSVSDGIPLAARINGGRKTMIEAVGKAVDAAKKAASSGSLEDILAYSQAKEWALFTAETIAGITAEMGRGLRAFRKIEGGPMDPAQMLEFLQSAHGKTPEELRAEATAMTLFQTPAQAAKFAQDTVKPTFKDMFLSYFINNLISGPLTHSAYAVGNEVWQLFKIGVDTTAAATIDSVRAAMGKVDAGERVYWGEVGAQLFAHGRAAREGLSPSYQAFKTGIINMKGDIHGVSATPENLGRRQTIPGTAGYILETPSRSVAAIHTMFYGMNYEAEIARRAYRSAIGDGLNPRTEDFNQYVARFIEAPPEPVMQEAHAEALQMVLMKRAPYDSSMAKLQSAVNSNLLAKLVMPFMQIGSNILREGFIEHSPVGLISKDVRANLSGANGDLARTTQYAKIGVGIGVSTSVIMAAAQGIITGSGPSAPKKRAEWEMTGWQPYAIRVGETFVPFRKYLGPLGPFVAASANLYEAGHAMAEGDLQEAATRSLFGLVEVIADETWMRGVSNFMDAMKHWDRDGGKYLRNLAMDFVPFSIGAAQVTRMFDPERREVHTYSDALQMHVPGMSQNLFPVRDIFGNAHPSRSMLTPSHIEDDPVMRELLTTDTFPARLEHKIRGVELTGQQYDDFSRIAGRLVRMALEKVVSQPNWADVQVGIRKEILTKVIDKSREAARSQIIMQAVGSDNDILKIANENKTKRLRDSKPIQNLPWGHEGPGQQGLTPETANSAGASVFR